MNTNMVTEHDEVWLLLPWLANGRLGTAERVQAEEHVRGCAECAQELQVQRRMCALLTEPERITYAPGPSLRKLMERIDDGHSPPVAGNREPTRAPVGRRALAATWRPPGLAWAATFVLALTLGLLMATAYRWSQPLYATYTSAPRAPAEVLHVAFDPALPFGTVEELLRSAGARVVEGPDTSGVFGIAPEQARTGESGAASPALRTLATRLRGDPRVRWIEPLPGTTASEPRGNTPVR
jgi:hypothetical protein